MRPNQIYKFLNSKGNHEQHEKTIDWEKKNCKRCDLQGLNFQNIQTSQTTQ